MAWSMEGIAFMLLTQNDVVLARDEASGLLQLPGGVIDALVASGAVRTEKRDEKEMLAAVDLERVFRDSLLRLYHAQAASLSTTETVAAAKSVVRETYEEIEIPMESAGESEPVLALASEELLSAKERPDLRVGARYVPRRQIGGVFRDVKFVMLQLSSSGLRIRHDEPLRPGDEARLSFAILHPPTSFVMRARVVWTSIAQRGDERSFYISGLRVITNADRLVNAAYLLRSARELQIDSRDVRRRIGSTDKVPRPVNGLSDEDVVAIIQAVRTLASDPNEAARWHTRARFAYAEEEVRKVAPRGAREREEVLGIWEYLGRRLEVQAVAGVMQWIRSSQVAAV
jgi:hypothetical protein